MTRHPIALVGLAVPLLAAPACASSDDSWDAFREDVATACKALVQDDGEVEVEVNPFGSQSYGAAIVTLATKGGTDRMICVFDKETREAELTSPF